VNEVYVNNRCFKCLVPARVSEHIQMCRSKHKADLIYYTWKILQFLFTTAFFFMLLHGVI